MKLKTKAQMNGKELCELEGVIFPYLADMDGGDTSANKKAAINMVNDNRETILRTCYLNDDGTEITDFDIPSRMTIMQDFEKILGFVLGDAAKKPEGAKAPQQIKKR